MPNYDYDPSDYSNDGDNRGGGSNLIPNGKHIVKVRDHELSETSSGLGQVVVEFEDRDGRTRKAWLICEGRAGFQFGALLNACGWTSKIDLSKPGVVKQAIYNKFVEIVVKDEEYNGETKPRVKYINKAPMGAGWSSAPTPGRPHNDPPRDEPPPPGDGDIPW